MNIKKQIPQNGRRITKMITPETKVLDIKKGLVQTVVSSENEDRDCDTISSKGWMLDYFYKHPVLISSHDYAKLTNQIGEWEDMSVKNKKLIGVAKYYVGEGNQEADWGFKLAEKGRAAYSVGFIPLEWEERDSKDINRPQKYGGGYNFTKQELLEVSQVTVPANPDALQLIAKGNFDPYITDIASGILSDNILDDLYNEDRAKKNMLEMKGMEVCNCYAPGCTKSAPAHILFCPDHLLKALNLLVDDEVADIKVVKSEPYEIKGKPKAENDEDDELEVKAPDDEDEDEDDEEEMDEGEMDGPAKPQPKGVEKCLSCGCLLNHEDTDSEAKEVDTEETKILNESNISDGGALVEEKTEIVEAEDEDDTEDVKDESKSIDVEVKIENKGTIDDDVDLILKSAISYMVAK